MVELLIFSCFTGGGSGNSIPFISAPVYNFNQTGNLITGNLFVVNKVVLCVEPSVAPERYRRYT